ncbi:uncharacterized protein LOC143281778 isoform X1 [Babylonia areolata]
MCSQLADLDQVFPALDTDGDHFLTLQEMSAYFKQADRDGNSKVTFEEYAHDIPPNQRHTPEVQGPFNYYDKVDGNVDGFLLPSDVSIIFNKLDSNNDSKLSKHEFLTGFQEVGVAIQAEIDALKTPVGK